MRGVVFDRQKDFWPGYLLCLLSQQTLRPKLIFADEPTGNLDTTTGEVIINLLLELNKKRGITIVIVTHDQELAQRCDEQIFMKDGEIKKTVKLHPSIKSPLIKSAKKASQ